MSEVLRTQVGRYLDGAASAAERDALERALVDAEVARLFAEELLLRDLLRHAPPEVPPEEVVARWEAAVLGELDAAAEDAPGWITRALAGFDWSLRGPAMTFSAAGALGASALRFGPQRRRSLEAPKKSWWRRAWAWRRR